MGKINFRLAGAAQFFVCSLNSLQTAGMKGQNPAAGRKIIIVNHEYQFTHHFACVHRVERDAVLPVKVIYETHIFFSYFAVAAVVCFLQLYGSFGFQGINGFR